MGITHKPIDHISEDDIRELVENGASEGLNLEFKRDMYGTSDNERKELIKDVNSLANTNGGQLVIGIAEENGIATDICPIHSNADAELQRLESILRDSIEPRIFGILMKAVWIASGGYVIIIRLPRSWNTPHRTSFKGSHRFYGRTSAGAYELSVDELRASFNRSSTEYEAAKDFRDDRLRLLDDNVAQPALIKQNGYASIHLYPFGRSHDSIISLPRAAALGNEFAPIGTGSGEQIYNFDGIAFIRNPEHLLGYTQIFRNGSLESVKSNIAKFNPQDGMYINISHISEQIIKSLNIFIRGFYRLQISPPIVVMITLSDVYNSLLKQFYDNEATQTIGSDRLKLPAVVIDQYGAGDYSHFIKPSLDALWNAGGWAECPHFKNGAWHSD